MLMYIYIIYTILKIFNFLIFNFAPLHVLRLGGVPHLPHPCYGFVYEQCFMLRYMVSVNRMSDVKMNLLSNRFRKYTLPVAYINFKHL
jgi:hypothetical protein